MLIHPQLHQLSSQHTSSLPNSILHSVLHITYCILSTFHCTYSFNLPTMASTSQQCKHICSVIPPFLIADILDHNEISETTRHALNKTLNHTAKLQGLRNGRRISRFIRLTDNDVDNTGMSYTSPNKDHVLTLGRYSNSFRQPRDARRSFWRWFVLHKTFYSHTHADVPQRQQSQRLNRSRSQQSSARSSTRRNPTNSAKPWSSEKVTMWIS